MLGFGQCVLTGNVEFVKANIMEKHIDAAEVVGSDIDLLPIIAPLYSVFAQHLPGLQKQGTGPAGRVYVHTDFDTKEKALSGAKAAEKGLK